MKRLSVLLISLMLTVGCAKHIPVTPPGNVDFAITVTWNYNFTNFAQCSGTVTKGCISGFTWGYLQGSTQVPLHTVSTTACTGSTQPESCTDTTNSQLHMGSLTGYIAANFVDNSGNPGSTPVVTTATPTTVTADLPTNFIWLSVK